MSITEAERSEILSDIRAAISESITLPGQSSRSRVSLPVIGAFFESDPCTSTRPSPATSEARRLSPHDQWLASLLSSRAPAMTQEEHLSAITTRQNGLQELTLDQNGASAHWGSSPSKGCVACKSNRWVTVFIGKACNATCGFCPQAPKPKIGDARDTNGRISTSFAAERYDELLPKLLEAIAARKLDAVGYSGGEPLMYVERIEEYASAVSARYPLFYQYIYTNGLLLTSHIVKRLKAVGIKEIRFDLAATEFSRKVIDRMRLARGSFMITVEVPAVPGIAGKLAAHAETLIDIGVHQINLCEVVVNEFNADYFRAEPFYLFNPHERDGGSDTGAYTRVVPVRSRHETYDLLEMAEARGWPFVINDCSQGVHYKTHIPY